MAKVRVSYRFEEELSKNLNNVSFLLGKTKNDIVSVAVKEYLDKLIKTEKLEEKINSLND